MLTNWIHTEEDLMRVADSLCAEALQEKGFKPHEIFGLGKRLLMVFPRELYPFIPAGYKVTNLNGITEPFNRNKHIIVDTTKSHLTFGIIANKQQTQK